MSDFDESSTPSLPPKSPQSGDLRIRIAAAIMQTCHGVYMDDAVDAADAVISELDLGIPCAANGCTMRRIARYHAEKSSKLEFYD